MTLQVEYDEVLLTKSSTHQGCKPKNGEDQPMKEANE
jgi:hypothetical protein